MKVKFIGLIYDYPNLTTGVVYNVIEMFPSKYGINDNDIIRLETNNGVIRDYYMNPSQFENATIEYRDCLIDEILL